MVTEASPEAPNPADNPLDVLGADIVDEQLQQHELELALKAQLTENEGAQKIATDLEEGRELEQDPDAPLSPQLQKKMIQIGALTAAAGGAYLLYSYFKKDKEEATGMDKAMKTAAIAALGGGAVLGLSAHYAPDQIGKGAQMLGVSLSDRSYERFKKHWENGEYSKAAKAFRFITEDKGVLETADLLNLDLAMVSQLSELKYSELTTWEASISRAPEEAFNSILKMLGMNPEADLPYFEHDDRVRKVETTRKVLAYIKENKDSLKGDATKMTVGQILNELEGAGIVKEKKEQKENSMRTLMPVTHEKLDQMFRGELGAVEGMLTITKAAISEGAAVVLKNGEPYLLRGNKILAIARGTAAGATGFMIGGPVAAGVLGKGTYVSTKGFTDGMYNYISSNVGGEVIFEEEDEGFFVATGNVISSVMQSTIETLKGSDPTGVSEYLPDHTE